MKKQQKKGQNMTTQKQKKGQNMTPIMETYRTRLTGQWVAQCPECRTVCTYWDEDDLNENGQLECDKCHTEND